MKHNNSDSDNIKIKENTSLSKTLDTQLEKKISVAKRYFVSKWISLDSTEYNIERGYYNIKINKSGL